MDTLQIHKAMTLISLTKSKVVTFATVLLVGIFCLPGTLIAQSSLVLSVSPTLFDMSANKGQEWSSSVRVINANKFPITVYAEPVNFEPSGEVGQGTLTPVFESESDGATLAEWIDVTSKEVVIPPEQTVSVPFSIAVPPDAAPGGHFAAILIGTRSYDDGPGQAQVETSQVVTALVFLRVAGDVNESGQIREFTSTSGVYETADATFSIRFENTGNVHVQPQGEIEIKNMWGQVRAVIPVNKNSQFGNVLPDSIRNYTYHWSADWSLADIGRHTAVVTLAYGDTQRNFVDATTYFWVIPWKLMTLILLLLGGFVSLIVWGIKLYVRRMLSLAGVTPELQRQTHSQAAPKRVSVVAPLEAGILDLRNELREGSGTVLSKLWSFALAYRAFMFIMLAVVVFVVLLVWYITLVVKNDFNYEVQYEQPDGTTVPVEIGSDDGDVTQPVLEAVDITVINHSGIPDAVDQIETKLNSGTYNITQKREPFNGAKDRSVIVYDPAYVEAVEVMQQLLPQALVSAYVSEGDDTAPITLYVGTDLVE